jgi:hypothetical protein
MSEIVVGGTYRFWLGPDFIREATIIQRRGGEVYVRWNYPGIPDDWISVDKITSRVR